MSIPLPAALPVSPTVLKLQRMVSILCSVVIAMLLAIQFSLILFLISLEVEEPRSVEIVAYNIPAEVEIEEPLVVDEVPNVPKPPAASLSKVIASNFAAELAVPTFDLEISESALELVSSEDFGEGWDSSDSIEHVVETNTWKSLPKSMSARCSKTERLKRLKKSGGTVQCDDAVLQALQWFQSTQNNDGSWSNRNQVGFTGLALLCYLGHCETPHSPEFGETVQNAITYLVDIGISNNGRMAADYSKKHWPYEHAIATYALAEAYTLCKETKIDIPNLEDVIVLATQHIISHQHSETGAWDYQYYTTGKRGGDSSIVCWHLQALKACKLSNISRIKRFDKTVKRALNYLEECQHKDGSIHYQQIGHKQGSNGLSTMTGATILCFQQWQRPRSSIVRKSATFTKKNVCFDFNNQNSDLYSHYYYAQALINIGGSTWHDYNTLFRDSLLENQNDNGSWRAPGGGSKITGLNTRYYQGSSKSAVHYRTCLAVLMLEVYYRYLPTQ